MKNKIILSIASIVIIGIAGAYLYYKPIEKRVNFNIVDEYVIKDTIPLSEDNYNYFIIENQDETDTLFDTAEVDANPIDFSKNFLIAITTSLTSKDSKITINSVKTKKDSLYVFFSFIEGDETDIISIPSQIVEIEKPNLMLDLYFINNGSVTQKVALGRRNLESPETEEDFRENYTGTFEGTFPCADCAGIKSTLTINSDNTYKYIKTYEGTKLHSNNETTLFTEEGTWSISDDLVVLDLAASDVYFYIYDKNTLELLSPDLKRINSEFNYKLIRD